MRAAMRVAYHPHDIRTGKTNNDAKVRRCGAGLDNRPDGAIVAGGRTNTLVYSR